MDRVHHQAERPIASLRHVAVVIGEPLHDQRHTGIVFQVDASVPHQFMHLAWHNDFRLQKNLGSNYCWVDPNMPTARLRQVAAICEDIAHANQHGQIPYSFGSPISAFDEQTKEFLVGPTNTGLTCASFVLAVFERAQLRLTLYHGWAAPDAEDIRWQEMVLEKLRNDGVSTEHIRAVEQETGTSVRYRPEHVAGAAAIRGRRPVKYIRAKAIGLDIVRFLRGEPPKGHFKFSWWERFLRKFGWL